MLATFAGGPYDGRQISRDDLTIYAGVRPIGYRLFLLLPSEWKSEGLREHVYELIGDRAIYELGGRELAAAKKDDLPRAQS
jgi:hypothetical protein